MSNELKSILGSGMGSGHPNGDGWEKWATYVLLTLERLEDDMGKMSSKLDALNTQSQVDFSKLRIKSGLIGLLGGAIPVTIGLLVWLIQYLAK